MSHLYQTSPNSPKIATVWRAEEEQAGQSEREEWMGVEERLSGGRETSHIH